MQEANKLIPDCDTLQALLEQEFNTASSPKKDLLFSKAYDAGHSSGWYEVVQCYENLADLVK